ncbi:MAG: hypothetical protein ACJ8G3_26150 [Burkholderiaceae bacterium]
MCVSGVHYFAGNAYTKSQSKGIGSEKILSKNEQCGGKINQRAAETMPCGTGRVVSNSKVWMGVKLIAAMACQQIFGCNKRAMTFLFLGIFASTLKATESLSCKQRIKSVRFFMDILKFFEFSFYKQDFKETIKPVFTKYSKGFQV